MKKQNKIHPKNKLYCILYRLRKQGLRVSLKEKTIYYNCNTPEIVQTKTIKRLCDMYGFGKQSEIE